MTKALVIGALGYVGRRAALALKERGLDVYGCTRRPEALDELERCGLRPLLMEGSAEDFLAKWAQTFDLVVIAAKMNFAEEAEFVRHLLRHFQGKGRTLIFASGTGVLSVAAPNGEWNESVFAEDDPFPFPELGARKARLPTEEMVRHAAPGLRAMVVRLPLVWGHGGSDHVPYFFRSAAQRGQVDYLGRGLNVISNVHVDDAAQLFCAAFERGKPGGLYHAVAGEADFRTIAEAAAQVCGCPVNSLPYKDMVSVSGREWVNLGLAVNSRTQARRSREKLGWAPAHPDLIGDIREGSYAQAWKRGAYAAVGTP